MWVMFNLMMWLFFFFKQKTAYEMRIRDWSSDVCSSDLLIFADRAAEDRAILGIGGRAVDEEAAVADALGCDQYAFGIHSRQDVAEALEIGRESCRERVCQYV